MFGKKPTNTTLEIFAIYDTKAQSYSDPFLDANVHSFTRSVMNTFRQQANNRYLVNAEDYAIYRIGSYSNLTGKIATQDPEHVANMNELRAAVQAEQPSNSTQMGIVPT